MRVCSLFRLQVALRVIKAHEGPITTLVLCGGALASGGADGFVHLYAPPEAAGGGAPPPPGQLERVHTYLFRHVDALHNPAARTASGGADANPNAVTRVAPTEKKEKPPPAASSTKPPTALPTTSNGGVGAIRSLCLVPLGAKRTAAANRRIQIPTLYAGTARCSLWRLEPQGGTELSCGHFGEATGCARHPSEMGAFASVGADKQLLLWNAQQRQPMERLMLSKPARCVAYSSDGGLIGVGHDDGSISVLRPKAKPAGGGNAPNTGVVAAQPPLPSHATGGSGAIEVVSFAPGSSAHGGYVACGSHDRMVRIFELVPERAAGGGGGQQQKPALGARIGARSGAAPSGTGSTDAAPRLKLVPRFCCSGHTSTVTHLDWSSDGELLMSNCAAHEILVWGVRDGKRHAQPGKALAATHWHDWTCYLGFPVQGIWPPGSNPTDVNAVHMTSDRALLLCAGDAGGLQLFNAPCVVEGAPYVVGTGHCTAITCCRFLLGDRTAVSTGGGDRSVMVWRLVSAAGGERERFEGGARGGARAGVAALPSMPHRTCMLNNPPTG